MERKLRYQGIPKPKAGGSRLPGPQNVCQKTTVQKTQTCSVTKVVEQPPPQVAQSAPCPGGARPKQSRLAQNRLAQPKPVGALQKPCAIAKQIPGRAPQPQAHSPARAATPVNNQPCDSPKQARGIPQPSGIAQPRRSLQAPKVLAKPAASPCPPKTPVGVDRLIQKPDASVAETGLLPKGSPAVAASPARAKRPPGGGFGFGAKRASGLKPPSAAVVPKIVAVPVEPQGACPSPGQQQEEQPVVDCQGMVEVPVVVAPGSPARSIKIPLEVACSPEGALVAIDSDDSPSPTVPYSRYEEECEELEGLAAVNLLKRICMQEEAERVSTMIALEGMQEYRRAFVMDVVVPRGGTPTEEQKRMIHYKNLTSVRDAVQHFNELCEESIDAIEPPEDWDEVDDVDEEEVCGGEEDFVYEYNEVEEEIDPLGLFRRQEIHSVTSVCSEPPNLIDLEYVEPPSADLYRLVQL